MKMESASLRTARSCSFSAPVTSTRRAGRPSARQKLRLNGLDEALLARESERSWPVIRKGLLFTLVGLALLVLFWWLVWKAYHFVFDYLHEKERTFPYRMRFWGIEFLPHLAGALYTLLKVGAWLFTLGALYSWLTVSLGHFPYTEPWGKQLGGLCLPLLRDSWHCRGRRAARHLFLHRYLSHHALGDTAG